MFLEKQILKKIEFYFLFVRTGEYLKDLDNYLSYRLEKFVTRGATVKYEL